VEFVREISKLPGVKPMLLPSAYLTVKRARRYGPGDVENTDMIIELVTEHGLLLGAD